MHRRQNFKSRSISGYVADQALRTRLTKSDTGNLTFILFPRFFACVCVCVCVCFYDSLHSYRETNLRGTVDDPVNYFRVTFW